MHTSPLSAIMPDGWQQQAAEYEASAAHADLVLTLDQQLYPALQEPIRAYARKYGLKIVVGNGTCGISAGKLGRNQVDMGGFCCPPGPMDRLPGLQFHTIGIAAIALITHAANPLENLSLKQAREVFSGNIERWNVIGGNEKSALAKSRIKPVARLHCKKRPGHWRLLLDREELFSPVLYEVGAIPDMIARVAESPAAVGYESLWMIRRFKDKGEVKVLSVDGIPPSDGDALARGQYPLYRTYSISSWASGPGMKPQAAALVAHLQEIAPDIDPVYGIVPHQQLRAAGWSFSGDELAGTPRVNP